MESMEMDSEFRRDSERFNPKYSIPEFSLCREKIIKPFNPKMLDNEKFMEEFKKSKTYILYKIKTWDDERKIIIRILSYLEDLPSDHKLFARLDELNFYITLAEAGFLYEK